MGDLEPHVPAVKMTVVLAMPLPDAARRALSASLGPQVDVFDIRDDVEHVDVLVTPPCSPNAIAALKRAYPTARIVLAEYEDWLLGVDLRGPLRRMLDAGADAYVVARSTDELGRFLTALPAAAGPPVDAPAALVVSSVDDLIIQHAEAAAARRR